MTVQKPFKRKLLSLRFIWLTIIAADADAPPSLKKVRIGVSETHVSYLPLLYNRMRNINWRSL